MNKTISIYQWIEGNYAIELVQYENGMYGIAIYEDGQLWHCATSNTQNECMQVLNELGVIQNE